MLNTYCKKFSFSRFSFLLFFLFISFLSKNRVSCGTKLNYFLSHFFLFTRELASSLSWNVFLSPKNTTFSCCRTNQEDYFLHSREKMKTQKKKLQLWSSEVSPRFPPSFLFFYFFFSRFANFCQRILRENSTFFLLVFSQFVFDVCFIVATHTRFLRTFTRRANFTTCINFSIYFLPFSSLFFWRLAQQKNSLLFTIFHQLTIVRFLRFAGSKATKMLAHGNIASLRIWRTSLSNQFCASMESLSSFSLSLRIFLLDFPDSFLSPFNIVMPARRGVLWENRARMCLALSPLLSLSHSIQRFPADEKLSTSKTHQTLYSCLVLPQSTTKNHLTSHNITSTSFSHATYSPLAVWKRKEKKEEGKNSREKRSRLRSSSKRREFLGVTASACCVVWQREREEKKSSFSFRDDDSEAAGLDVIRSTWTHTRVAACSWRKERVTQSSQEKRSPGNRWWSRHTLLSQGE